jgi:hypothetical protein
MCLAEVIERRTTGTERNLPVILGEGTPDGRVD